MSNQFMPLSGAILVTNPRRSVPVGLALKNGDRGRLNAATRVHVKTGMPIKKLVKMIAGGKSTMAIKKAGGLYVAPRTKKKEYLEQGIAKGANTSKKKQAKSLTITTF